MAPRPSVGFALTSLSIASLVLACALRVRPEQIEPPSFDVRNRHPASVTLRVEGGFEGGGLLSNSEFLRALRSSVQKSQVFSDVRDDLSADYLLEVQLIGLHFPVQGFNMTATLTASWVLSDPRTGVEFLREIVSTPYTATVGAAFVGLERQRLAKEGAVRENLRAGIRRLSEIELRAPTRDSPRQP